MYDRYRRYPSFGEFPQGNPGYMNSNSMYGADNNRPMYNSGYYTRFADYGPEPFVVNIEEVTKRNNTFRTALWTGKHLQLTLMSINPGEDIGLEIHPLLDQFLRIEEGSGVVMMGRQRDYLEFQRNVSADFAFIIPAGTWHNVINTGSVPMKLYSIYAPPQHPFGTVHETKADAEAAEEHGGY
jgi:mannose-6-phosphate isomerase-like protein (cupin superfamily)